MIWAGRRIVAALLPAVNQPDEQREDSADPKPDEDALERVADRQPKDEAQEQEKGEETSTGEGTAALHRALMAERAHERHGHMVKPIFTMFVGSPETADPLIAETWTLPSSMAGSALDDAFGR